MDRATLLLHADSLYLMAQAFNEHDGQLAGQYNAYGHCMAAMEDVLTELYGAGFARQVRLDVGESGESPSESVAYRVNCDHAEAIETADAEMAVRA